MKITRREFEELVRQALAEVPEQFLPYLENLSVEIEDMPSARDCREAEVDDPQWLLGLYHGTPLTEKSVEHPYHWPERITIYRKNIQRVCRTRREIIDQVRTTVLHEIGHHFGLDEDDLEELGYD
jgi:predicted Zn-dependent protease with MMP-like domain